MKFGKFGLIVSLVAAMSLVAACGSNSGSGGGAASGSPSGEASASAAPAESAKLVIARESGASSGLLFIADKKGFLTEQGLEYEIASYANGSAAVDALQAKEIQVAFGAADTFPIRGADSGIKGLAAISQQPDAVQLVASSDVNGPEDLKGKSIGVVPNTVSQFVLENVYMEQAGLKSGTDYTSVPTQPAQMVALMARGGIQAFALWAPFPAKAVESMGDKVKILESAGNLGFPNTTFMLVREDSLTDDAYRASYVKFLKGLKQAQQFLAENPDESAQIIGDATQVSKEDALATLEDIRLEPFLDDSAYTEIKTYNDVLLKSGTIEAAVDGSTVIDDSIMKEAGL
ncbi:ABC transporter substrate-binding protein [Cohnella algarum]|uniref:ABC transporter substrate-binding protein n=1 Tax=Cohnella algarum TaxID=2044859 RepID=UPI0019689338|nr:ABC transporter substrate-binding protein [Cohnella algarum]MBN2983521.1 ABC transporter substrate-binding protein [Cohnella algarum]